MLRAQSPVDAYYVLNIRKFITVHYLYVSLVKHPYRILHVLRNTIQTLKGINTLSHNTTIAQLLVPLGVPSEEDVERKVTSDTREAKARDDSETHEVLGY